MKILRLLLLASLFCSLVGTAKADTAFGVPVTGSTSTTPAIPTCPALEGVSCFNPTTGAITFFIPLSTANGGVFGVTSHAGGTAGTFSDSGSGAANTLTMFLMFTPVAVPSSSATLTFSFVDLDLSGVNDPAGFLEQIRFYDSNGNPLTPWITTNGQSSGSGLTFYVSGNSIGQTIFFPDITSIVQNPFFVQLNFGSSYTGTGKNTPESLTATLNSTPVPEPGTLLLFGLGLLAVAGVSRRGLRK